MAHASEIRRELIELIEHESDTSVLQAIRTLLSKTSLNKTLKEKLTARALKSQEDIKRGRVFNQDEVIERTDRTLDG